MTTVGATFIQMQGMISICTTMRDLEGVLVRDVAASAEEEGKKHILKEHTVDLKESSMELSLDFRFVSLCYLFPLKGL